MSSSDAPRVASSLPMVVVTASIALLIVTGVAASIGRMIFVGEAAQQAEPIRQAVLEAFDRADLFPAQRAAEVALIDERFGRHRFITWMHVVPGALFLVLAPIQFASKIRRRHIRFHRWCGRFLLVDALFIATSGFFFGVLIPIAGFGESSAIVLFGTFFLFAMLRAVILVRRRDMERHREWMIRAFAAALAISTVRIVAGGIDFALTPRGFPFERTFVISLWAGWSLTLAAAELWIRHTRHSSRLRT